MNDNDIIHLARAITTSGPTRYNIIQLYLAAEEWLHNDGVNVSINRDIKDLDE